MPDDVEFTANNTLIKIGDRWVRDVDGTFTHDRIERIRQGYECINCHYRFDSAFPETCPEPVCQFPVRKEQSLEFLKRFKGHDENLWDYDKDGEPLDDYIKRGERELQNELRHEKATKLRLRKKGIYIP